MPDDAAQGLPAPPAGNFRGHDRNKIFNLAPDPELTEVGPCTPSGEYLRRFWQPIAMTSMVGELPLRIRRLGEDLVLFRDGSGAYGLLHLYCAHRNTSLEYGIIENAGIRCCYHGWLFAPDGTILETPGEPETSSIRRTHCQGAYPVVEYHGLIFAYFGPAASMPPFPVFDTMQLPDDTMVPLLIPVPCNWVQVFENSSDPFHVTFLHTRVSGPQFQENLKLLPTVTYHDRPTGHFYTSARKVGDLAWFRVHDHLLPNFSQNGGMHVEGNEPVYFVRTGLTRWIVPVDDTNTLYISWRHFNLETDPNGKGRPDKCGYNSADFYGQTDARDYEQRQRSPGDFEAWIGQGEITVHAREIMAFTDKGVAAFRRRLRRAIRALKDGTEPPPMTQYGQPVPTYGGDTILRVPPTNMDDATLLTELSHKIAAIYQSADALTGQARIDAIRSELKALESRGCDLSS
jgi:nitrite reductase/ring-hydroxylating ferredoxin subunit